VTVELVSQLNEMLKCKDGVDRTKLHRLVKNLITQATTGADVVDEKGNVTHEGAGDLQAILAIYDRLEGRPSQKLLGPDNGPVQVEYKTIEEVRMFLLERGIDSTVGVSGLSRVNRLSEEENRELFYCRDVPRLAACFMDSLATRPLTARRRETAERLIAEMAVARQRMLEDVGLAVDGAPKSPSVGRGA
jgi:hypothetical protein